MSIIKIIMISHHHHHHIIIVSHITQINVKHRSRLVHSRYG